MLWNWSGTEAGCLLYVKVRFSCKEKFTQQRAAIVKATIGKSVYNASHCLSKHILSAVHFMTY